METDAEKKKRQKQTRENAATAFNAGSNNMMPTPLGVAPMIGNAAVDAYNNGVGKTIGEKTGKAYRGAVTGATNAMEFVANEASAAGKGLGNAVNKAGQYVGEQAFNATQAFKNAAGIKPTITPAENTVAGTPPELISQAGANETVPVQAPPAEKTLLSGQENVVPNAETVATTALQSAPAGEIPAPVQEQATAPVQTPQEVEGAPGVYKNDNLSAEEQKKYGKAIYSDSQEGATKAGFDTAMKKGAYAQGYDEKGNAESTVSKEASDYYDKNGSFAGFNVSENRPEGGGLSWHEKAKIAQSKMPFGSRGDVFKRKAIQGYIDSLKGVADVEAKNKDASRRTDIEEYKAANPTAQSQVGRFKHIPAQQEEYDPVTNTTKPAQPAMVLDSMNGTTSAIQEGETPEQAFNRIASNGVTGEGGGYSSPEAIGDALKSGKIKNKEEAIKLMDKYFPNYGK